MDKRYGEDSLELEEQYQPLEVNYGPESSLPPPPGFASTALMSSNVPSTDTRALESLESHRQQKLEEMKKEKSRLASRECRKRKKATFEYMEESCKQKDRVIECLTSEKIQLIQTIKKLETEIAFMKGNQNEAMKILSNSLRSSD